MTIESDGVTTVVSREYEPDEIEDISVHSSSGERAIYARGLSTPDVTRAVALAAAIAHHPKEN